MLICVFRTLFCVYVWQTCALSLLSKSGPICVRVSFIVMEMLGILKGIINGDVGPGENEAGPLTCLFINWLYSS